MAVFWLGDMSQRTALKRVVFEIEINSDQRNTRPYADISNDSEFFPEAEVLFMIRSIFRINSICPEGEHLSIIRMSVCSDDEHELDNVVSPMKNQNGNGETNLLTLGKLLSRMGKFELAEKYFLRFKEQLPTDHPILETLYEDIATMFSQRSNYNMSIHWQKKAQKLKQSKTPSDLTRTSQSMRFTSKLCSTTTFPDSTNFINNECQLKMFVS